MNTKERHAEIHAAAVAAVAAADIDAAPDRLARLRALYRQVAQATNCHPETAKRNVAQVMRRNRFQSWGGARAGAGRPRKEVQK